MDDTANIEQNLRAALPPDQHPQVGRLAHALADLAAAPLRPEQARARLADPDLVAALRSLVGQPLTLAGGDVITVGNLKENKGTAVGAGAIAIADLAIHIHQQAPLAMSPPSMAPPPPPDFVPRPVEFGRIIAHLLDADGAAPVALTAALRGASGYGKTTLAAAICRDRRVRAAFPGGILWVTLGERPAPSDLTARIADLVERLDGRRPGFASVEAATEALATALADNTLLLVIDDVWDGEHLRPFLQGGPRCTRLVTTRLRDTLPSGARTVDVDAMRQDEALALLVAGLAPLPGHVGALRALAARLGEWPLLLKLINGVLREQIDLGATLDAALAYVDEGLAEEGLIAFDTLTAEGRNHAVARTLGVSLARLNDAERARFAELAIFPEDITIPLATLGRYWHVTGGLSSFAVKQLCARLFRLSLLLAYDGAAQTIRLHDVVRGYLEHAYATELTRLHAALLDAHRPPSGAWADLPYDEPYLWDPLVLHLARAGRGDELAATAADLRYLAIKTFLRESLAAEGDLLAAELAAPDDAILRQLRRSFVQCGHLLNACADLETLKATLHSRLCHISVLAPLAAHFEPALARPYLAPRHPLPDLPDPALVRTLTGHTDRVYGCAVSADGQVVVSASSDFTLKVWDVSSGQERATLEGHTGAVNGCAVSADGRVVVSTSNDGTLKVWDASSGHERATLEGHTNWVNGCAVSADGRVVVSASSDFTLKVWDVSSGQERTTFEGHTGEVRGCAMSVDGQVMVSASNDGTLKIWDASSGQERATLEGHTDDGTLKIWDASSGQERATLEGHTDWVRSCAMSANGRVVVSASFDRTLKVWDASSGQERATLEGHTGEVRGCAVSADGQVMVSASEDGTLKVWDTSSGRERATLEGHTGAVNGCAVSADGQVVVSASSDFTLKVWDASSNQERATLEGHTGEVRGCAVSADGQVVVSASEDGTLKVWDAKSGQERAKLEGHTNVVNGCAVSANGRVVVSASFDRTLRVWDASSGQQRATLEGHTNWVYGCAVSTDGRVVVSASFDRTLRVWDASSGQQRATLEGHTNWVYGCAVSADGRVVVSASNDGTLKVWDAESGQERATLQGHTGVMWGCAVSGDGRVVVSASSDGTLKLWDGESGQERATLQGHTDWVRGCAVSADGRVVVSASDDRTLKVWDASSGACLATLHVESPLLGCACSADGQWLAAAGQGGGVYLLRLVM